MPDARVAPEGLRRVHLDDGVLYMFYAKSIVRWPLGSSAAGVIANPAPALTDIAMNIVGDWYMLFGGLNRISCRRKNQTQLVDLEKLKPKGATFLALDGDHAIYFAEAGRQVKRFAAGETSVVAGGSKKGASPGHLDGVGGMVVARDGTLYISDIGNNRIQKWSPG